MAEETTSTSSSSSSSYYQKLLEQANANIASALPSATASDDQMFARYVDRYKQLGNLAMQDTIGQGAALTGGYTNSYAQNVGQQAYDSYLQEANDNMYDYALQSKQLALQQDEYANNLAAAEFARQMEGAAVGATYGDFSLYGNLFGTDFANNLKAVWNKMYPNYATGTSSGGGGGSGNYYTTDENGDATYWQNTINQNTGATGSNGVDVTGVYDTPTINGMQQLLTYNDALARHYST